MLTRSARIHVQTLQGIIVYHFQDVGMTTDKKLYAMLHHLLFYARCITARVTSNVLHQYFNLFAAKSQVLRKMGADLRAINISPYATQGLEILQLLHKRCITEITRMPDFIAMPEMMKHSFVEKAMCV